MPVGMGVPGIVRAVARPWVARFRHLPTERHMRWRRVLYAPAEVADRLAGRRDPRLPPRWLRTAGRGDFEAVGSAYLDLFVRLGGLRPGDAVLDIGCGAGRMALPLSRYLDEDGSYEGFDVVPTAVRWCRRHITPRHPRFRFTVVDLANARYRPGGRRSAAEFSFPYPDATFDFAIATSLFTHLGPDALARYVEESARVLRPGGRLLSTLFLVDGVAAERIDAGATALRLTCRGAGYRTLAAHPDDPDYLVAYDETLLRDLLARHDLTVVEPIHRGSWVDPASEVGEQDVLVARLPVRQPNRTLRP